MDPNDLEALTPNHLLLLKASATLPRGVFQPSDIYAQRRWKQVQYMSDLFWRRWVTEYLPPLQEFQRWTEVKRNLVVGQLVIIMDSMEARNSLPVGQVIQNFPDRRGFVRQVRIKTRSRWLDWPITKVCLLQEAKAIWGYILASVLASLTFFWTATILYMTILCKVNQNPARKYDSRKKEDVIVDYW